MDHHIDELQRHVHTRLGDGSFTIDVTPEARKLLVERGTSAEYGARELKRSIHRMLTQPLAELVAAKHVAPGARVLVDRDAAGQALELRPDASAVVAETATVAAGTPSILVLDDNPHLREWLCRTLTTAGTEPVQAETLAQARELLAERVFDAALVDVVLPDGEGLPLALDLARQQPLTQVIVMSGMELSAEEFAQCERYGIPVLRKPFLLDDVVKVLRAQLVRRLRAARAAGEGA